jgi:hypothetical protein
VFNFFRRVIIFNSKIILNIPSNFLVKSVILILMFANTYSTIVSKSFEVAEFYLLVPFSDFLQQPLVPFLLDLFVENSRHTLRKKINIIFFF